jgi:hypothetical protein
MIKNTDEKNILSELEKKVSKINGRRDKTLNILKYMKNVSNLD